jgi:hypothetical protein
MNCRRDRRKRISNRSEEKLIFGFEVVSFKGVPSRSCTWVRVFPTVEAFPEIFLVIIWNGRRHLLYIFCSFEVWSLETILRGKEEEAITQSAIG